MPVSESPDPHTHHVVIDGCDSPEPCRQISKMNCVIYKKREECQGLNLNNPHTIQAVISPASILMPYKLLKPVLLFEAIHRVISMGMRSVCSPVEWGNQSLPASLGSSACGWLTGRG